MIENCEINSILEIIYNIWDYYNSDSRDLPFKEQIALLFE
jgi:hypothetical protein